MNSIKYIHVFFVVLFLMGSGVSYAQFKTLSLEECRKLGLEQNKKVKAAFSQTEAARASLKSVEANAYPSFNASLLGVYVGKPLAGALNGAIPEYFATGSLDVSQAIYAGGKIKNGKQAAGKVVEIRETQQELTNADVLMSVEKAYWQVVQVNEKIILATRFKEMLESLERDLKNSFDAGLIYKNDLLRVQVNLNEADLNIVKAKDGLVMAKLNLAQVIGEPGNTEFNLSDSVAGNFTPLPEQLFSGTVDNRPEIKVLTKALEAEEFQRKILKGDRLPSIGVSASGLTAAGNGVNISNGKDFMATYYGVASISFPVFDWGKRANKVKEQSLKMEAQRFQLEETKEFVSLEIQSAYLQLNQSARRVRTSLLSLQQADENLKLADDRFKAGTIVGKDVQEAQAIWQQTYSNLIDAKVEYKINYAAFKKAIGELN